MEKKTIYNGRTQRSEYGYSRETRLVIEGGNVLMAGSRGRALHMSVDGGDDTPWTETCAMYQMRINHHQGTGCKTSQSLRKSGLFRHCAGRS